MDEQDYQRLLTYLKNLRELVGEEYKKWASQFEEKYNYVYKKKWRIVSKGKTEWIMSMFHDNLTKIHQNADTMYQQISKRYFWQNMRQDIKNFARTYYKCQQKGSTKQNNQKCMILPIEIFERWEINIIGPLLIIREENRYIVITIDYFTRWSKARVIKAVNVKMIATFIYEKIICQFRLLRVLQSDRKTYFVNEVIQRVTKRFRIRYSLFSSYYLQLNRFVERFNKTLYKGIAKVAEEIEFWDKYIQLVLFAYWTKKLRILK